MNIREARQYLQSFDFRSLFIEELGWSNPAQKAPATIQTQEGPFIRKVLAELSGAVVLEVSAPDGQIPAANIRAMISAEVQKTSYEHILIFVDEARSQCVWRWIKKQDKKQQPREQLYSRGQSGDAFMPKLAKLVVDVSELENDITITDVAKKIMAALDVEKVTKKFYKDYQQQFIVFLELIEGIDNEADRRWYASVVLNRLMFIYFLQQKMFLDNGDVDYLSHKLEHSKASLGQDKFYSVFLQKLFFEGFAKPAEKRDPETRKLIGHIKYLNGGLFLEHKIEAQYKGKIRIPDLAFQNLFELFGSYSWTLNDTPKGNDNEINPDVLGYIFEKYINQKAFGAYYTRTEITEYLCQQTVHKLILDQVNDDVPTEGISDALLQKLDLKHFESIEDLFLCMDADTCRRLIVGARAVLPNLSLLDPACGSGAFLVAAMKVLTNVYEAVLGKIDYLQDKKLSDWKGEILAKHPSINYYIKKQIISHNLYGVDIMEEATEIAKLRLFLALVSSADTVEQLEPLPNIDFNIMPGNSLIGLMRVDPNKFTKQYEDNKATAKKQKGRGKLVQKADLFGKQNLIQTDIFASEHTKSYQQLINEKEAAISSYRNAHELDITDLKSLRDSIQETEAQAKTILDNLLLEEFLTLGIKYEQITWDTAKNKEGKSIKRNLDISDIQALEPFHWGYEFSEIFRGKNGFDAIITNPPWEVFKPNSKEFFQERSSLVTKKKMNIKDFETAQDTLLQDPEVREAWEQYLSTYPHVSEYYRSAEQYRNQISIVNGKKAGTDINLYKLFTELCHHLLRKGGYCGIVIPSGIYTDLGTKQLRKMLFEETRIQQLVSFANEKFIFENVHHAFKFCILSFEKGFSTSEVKATFRINTRECIGVDELDAFLSNPQSYINIPIDFVLKQSPDSLSIMEVRCEADFNIANKMLKFPVLGAKNFFNNRYLELGAEFHMTGDSHLFRLQRTEDSLPLYEGKMIHQFTHRFAEPKYWVDEAEGRKAVLGREEETEQTLDYQCYRIAVRAISSSTNERTLIAGLLPKGVFVGHSMNVSKAQMNEEKLLFVLSFLNSLCLDYLLRQSVTANLTLFFIYQLPVPRLQPGDTYYAEIVRCAAELVCTSEEYAELWEAATDTGWHVSSGAIDVSDREYLRAQLDAMVARVYGLSEEELRYILGTFPLVPEAQKQLVMEEFFKIGR